MNKNNAGWQIVKGVATVVGLITDILALYAFLTTGRIHANLPNVEIEVAFSRDGIALINLVVGFIVAAFIADGVQALKNRPHTKPQLNPMDNPNPNPRNYRDYSSTRPEKL